MLVNVVLNRIVAPKVAEHPFNRFDTRASFYQTWQLCDLESAAGTPRSAWATQGFSLRGDATGGSIFGMGETRDVDDPFISFTLPDLDQGQYRRFRLDVHWWESREDTAVVKGLFTAAALRLAVISWEEADGANDEARKLLEARLRKTQPEAKIPPPYQLGRVEWLPVTFDMDPPFSALLDAARSLRDPYLGMHGLLLEVREDQQQLYWRMISPSGAKPWKQGEGTQKVQLEMKDEGLGHQVTATYRSRCLA